MEQIIKEVYIYYINFLMSVPTEENNIQSYLEPYEVNTLKRIAEDVWGDIIAEKLDVTRLQSIIHRTFLLRLDKIIEKYENQYKPIATKYKADATFLEIIDAIQNISEMMLYDIQQAIASIKAGDVEKLQRKAIQIIGLTLAKYVLGRILMQESRLGILGAVHIIKDITVKYPVLSGRLGLKPAVGYPLPEYLYKDQLVPNFLKNIANITVSPTWHEIGASVASLHALSDILALLPAKHETPDTPEYKRKEKEYSDRVTFVQDFIDKLVAMLEQAEVKFPPEELIAHGFTWYVAQTDADDKIATEIERIINESLEKFALQKYKWYQRLDATPEESQKLEAEMQQLQKEIEDVRSLKQKPTGEYYIQLGSRLQKYVPIVDDMIKRWNKYAKRYDDKKKLTLQQMKRAADRVVDTELLQRYKNALEKTHKLVQTVSKGRQSFDFSLFKEITDMLQPVYLSERQIVKFLKVSKEFLEQRIANKDPGYDTSEARDWLETIEAKIREMGGTMKTNPLEDKEYIKQLSETISQMQEQLKNLAKQYEELYRNKIKEEEKEVELEEEKDETE